MQKITSLFQRNYDGDRLVRDEITPGAEWVVDGEGVATRKWDGTCCLIQDGKLYKRYMLRRGRKAPANFMPAQPEPDPVTGQWPGWVPVEGGPEDLWHLEALENTFPIVEKPVSSGQVWVEYERFPPPADGTYELVGPKIQGNPENFPTHVLLRHGSKVLPDAPRDYEGLKQYLSENDIEGIVWHHPDGRMVKIKGRDFGIKRQG